MSRYRAYNKPPVKPEGEWLRISHELTWSVDAMAGREDLAVKISPDAGYDDSAYENGELIRDSEGNPAGTKHPGVTFPDRAIIEIDGDYLKDIPLEDVKPSIPSNREQYPVVWGILGHEAAHAHYSKWVKAVNKRELTPEEASAAGAAILLEESRIEAKHNKFRPQDTPWIAAMAAKVALEECRQALNAARTEPGKEWDRIALARAAVLLLARIDSGSVTADETTEEIGNLVRAEFGEETFREMGEVWRAAQATGDYDDAEMMRLGKRWYELTGDAGDDAFMAVECDGEGCGDESALGKEMAKKAKLAEQEANGDAKRARDRARVRAKAGKSREEARARTRAKQNAQKKLTGQAGAARYRGHPVTCYRPPTAEEVSLARRTRRALQAAYVPERAVTAVSRYLPPGRLVLREAQQLDAQLEAGLMPDAEPFRFKDRKHVATPPLKVGIVQDVSGSQQAAAAAATSGAWSLAKAAQMILDAQVAMVSFGDSEEIIFKPFQRLPDVPVLRSDGGTAHFIDSLELLEGLLDLTRPGSARVVVILTDGQLNYTDMAKRDEAIKRLADYGVKFLWMDTDGGGMYLPAKHKNLHIFSAASGNYSIIPKMISQEAVNALKK